jgi:cystathionine beta-lyase/cystathionine gamma-synthase
MAVTYNLNHSRGASPYADRLVQLSIGMEETNDLIADLKQALPRMQDGH